MTNSQSHSQVSTLPVHWQTHQQQLKHIREVVFIQEQKVPIELEWDGLDEQAMHILAFTLDSKGEKNAIGTARILFNKKHAHIGRMAVLTEWRGQGIGSKILQCCIKQCCIKQSSKKPVSKIILNAQVYVMDFYKKAGFEISSDEFSDAGIPHREMTLTTKSDSKG